MKVEWVRVNTVALLLILMSLSKTEVGSLTENDGGEGTGGGLRTRNKV